MLSALARVISDNIVANQEATIDVTFATVEKGDYGYEGVRFKFAKVSGPGDATFIAIDSNDKPYLATMKVTGDQVADLLLLLNTMKLQSGR